MAVASRGRLSFCLYVVRYHEQDHSKISGCSLTRKAKLRQGVSTYQIYRVLMNVLRVFSPVDPDDMDMAGTADSGQASSYRETLATFNDFFAGLDADGDPIGTTATATCHHIIITVPRLMHATTCQDNMMSSHTLGRQPSYLILFQLSSTLCSRVMLSFWPAIPSGPPGAQGPP